LADYPYKMLIYSPENNHRVAWTIDLLFRQLLGQPCQITVRTDEIREYQGPKLAYSHEPIDDIPWIKACGLLFENSIHPQTDHLVKGDLWNGWPVIFAQRNDLEKTLVPFDILAATFYFVARYEEYLPFKPDQHGRFPSHESLAYRLDVLEEPIVNRWAIAFSKLLEEHTTLIISILQPKYQFIPTIDVDSAYAFSGKGILRTLAGIWKDRRDMEGRNFRFSVLRGNQPDPFDTYNLFRYFHHENPSEPIWFFQVGKHGRFDKNINPANRNFRQLVKQLSEEFKTGLHPSYASNIHPSLLLQEVETLTSMTGQPVIRSRQHYLKIRFPETYQDLLQAGIREEYSLGFADRVGYRAGIAIPFRFFDLRENTPTQLMVYPFEVMDTTLRQYMKLDPTQATQLIQKLIDTTREVGGTFISLWHNESLSEWKAWRGWSSVYRELIQHAAGPIQTYGHTVSS